jgi:hypothetical protein
LAAWEQKGVEVFVGKALPRAQPGGNRDFQPKEIFMAANKKHRNLTAATSWQAGYTEPSKPASKKGGKYPGHQQFDSKLRSKRK